MGLAEGFAFAGLDQRAGSFDGSFACLIDVPRTRIEASRPDVDRDAIGIAPTGQVRVGDREDSISGDLPGSRTNIFGGNARGR